MGWDVVIFGALQLLVEMLCLCAPPKRRPDPPPLTDSDNWKCPDAAAIARALGKGSDSAHDDRGRIGVLCDFLTEENSIRERTLRQAGRDPLWDRELDG
jgi:hypothetical protein